MLNRRAGWIAKQIENGVSELEQVSQDGQIAVCAVPEAERRGFHIERAIAEVNSEIWKLSKAQRFAVIDVNRKVHHAGLEVGFFRYSIHFSERLSLAVGERLAARAVAFFGGPSGAQDRGVGSEGSVTSTRSAKLRGLPR